MRRLFKHELTRFIIIGGVSFIIDTIILYALRQQLGLALARVCSFSIVVCLTWGLNRIYTFRSQDKQYTREWLRYTGVNIIAGSINLFGFIYLTYHNAFFHHYPFLALIIITAISASFNFMAQKSFVFRKNYRAVP